MVGPGGHRGEGGAAGGGDQPGVSSHPVLITAPPPSHTGGRRHASRLLILTAVQHHQSVSPGKYAKNMSICNQFASLNRIFFYSFEMFNIVNLQSCGGVYCKEVKRGCIHMSRAYRHILQTHLNYHSSITVFTIQ